MTYNRSRKSQAELPNALNLHSSATLGTGKTMTHLERLEREEHHEVKRIMDGSIRTGKRKRDAYAVYESEEEEDTFRGEDGASGNAPRAEPTLRHDSGTIRPKEVVVIDSVSFTTPPQRPTATVGGALQRNADGSVVAPRVVARKKKTLVNWHIVYTLWYLTLWYFEGFLIMEGQVHKIKRSGHPVRYLF